MKLNDIQTMDINGGSDFFNQRNYHTSNVEFGLIIFSDYWQQGLS